MRIALDLQGAQTESRFRGIGRYTISLAEAIYRNRGAHEVCFVLNGNMPESVDLIFSTLGNVVPHHSFHIWNGPDRRLGDNWYDVGWRKSASEKIFEAFTESLHADIIHISSLFEGFSDHSASSVRHPPGSSLVATTLYDLIPYIYRDMYIPSGMPSEKFYLDKIDHLKRSDICLAISDYTANEAVSLLSLEKKKVFNISGSTSDEFKKIAQFNKNEAAKEFSLSRELVLYTGGIDFRKNIDRLLGAFAALPVDIRRQHVLGIAGKMGELPAAQLRTKAYSLGLTDDNFRLFGYVSDPELVALYNICRLFVFPSLHEGFGLPALEAMKCGAPTIAAGTTSVPEVVGWDKALFDPMDVRSISDKMLAALTDDEFREELSLRGLDRARLFSWDMSAEKAIGAFESALSQSDRAAVKGGIDLGYRALIDSIASIDGATEEDLLCTAEAIGASFRDTRRREAPLDLSKKLKWRVEGPFDSSYSLALLNRETARALSELGHDVALFSTEGPGDFLPNSHYLAQNPDLNAMWIRSRELGERDVDVTSRILYPPRVQDMVSPINMLHHYAWEESGFPLEWVEEFNKHLQAITCLSPHVEKILIDHGVTVPLSVSGCGIDHWDRVIADPTFKLPPARFKFLHVSSCFPRKGADLLLDAYGRAFSSRDNVVLIIKTFPNPHNEIDRWFREAVGDRPDFPKVEIIIEDFDNSRLKALYEACDVLVAPSRAEGFGLPMAEAMMSGLPVITTAWGGQLDFCKPEIAWLVDYHFERAQTHFGLSDSVWATANISHLADTMRGVFELPKEELTQRAALGRKKLLREFRWTGVAQRLVEAAAGSLSGTQRKEPSIGWMSTWKKTCGIAGYSEHLLAEFSKRPVIFGTTDSAVNLPKEKIFRCWSESGPLDEISNLIREKTIDVLVIQFNYAFFEFNEFSYFVKEQINRGIIVVVVLHSTFDHPATPYKKLIHIAEALSICHRLLVHSVDDMNRLKDVGLVDNVTLFPHGLIEMSERPSQHVGHRAAERSYLLASYGFFLPHKGLHTLIRAVGLLRKNGVEVRLRMVNAEYANPQSRQLINQALELINDLGLDRHVEIHTEFLDDQESLALLADADLIVFPYENTGESSSAAVRHGIAAERPVAVTPLPIFDDVREAVFELPGHDAESISVGIRNLLAELAINSSSAKQKASDAERWRAAHQQKRLSARLEGMLKALHNKHHHDSWLGS
ncbi:glycosyltransferase [Mesorhizobium sp. B292B1B]|uniref:glycosyltransferase n=1 Tax=unclassified Mesorhizobium TaxID=325217 RepID=UPI001126E0E2|nr:MULTISPECIES: glycosyltransferase [unclassified Mesorhizobium]MCA0012520.1 glycosyltransferase [Mesorhizobium sp. B294B1A1]MCA0038897.1 glycosyltransferase [Mesorhizobium sp. B292B1B]TPM45742.1 glycosyltransferase [Mesorhizobium sp. B2-3-2]